MFLTPTSRTANSPELYQKLLEMSDIGECIGEYWRDIWGDTRSLKYSSFHLRFGGTGHANKLAGLKGSPVTPTTAISSLGVASRT